MRTKTTPLWTIYVLLLLVLTLSAFALSKPIAGYLYLSNGSMAYNATVTVYVNTTTSSVNPCYTLPSVYSGTDGSYATNLANLKRTDTGGDCSGLWATGDAIWAIALGSSVLPEAQGNGTTSGDTISSGTGLQYLQNATLTEIVPPVINLVSPEDNNVSGTGNVTFIYNVSDSSNISNCKLIINNSVNQTNTSITKDINQNFTLNNMHNGIYSWSVNCTDYYNNVNSSSSRTLNVSKIGYLQAVLISPAANANASHNQFFMFKSQVNCVNGNCGEVVAYLDPVALTPPQVSFWGKVWNYLAYVVDNIFLAPFSLTGMAVGELVPTTPSSPFWTNSSNPANSTRFSCLSNMQEGSGCNTTWYVNATGNITSVSEFYVIYNTSTYNLSAESTHINITIIDTTAPSVTGLSATPSAINQTQFTNITATVTDNGVLSTVRINLTAPNSSISTYTLIQGDSNVWSYQYNTTLTTAKGTYTVRLIANDTSGNINSSQTTTFTVADITAPSWSNNKTSPSYPVTYPSATNQFNVTWTDNLALSKVLIEHNFSGVLQNYTITTNLSGEFYYSYSNLGAGSYVWKMYANDTSNNWNSTSQYAISVSQADSSSSIHLYLNGSESDKNYTYGGYVNATGTKTISEGTLNLYRNGSLVSSGSSVTENSILAAGVWNYTLTYPATQNYSASSQTYFANVSQAVPTLTLTALSSWNVVSGTQTNVSCSPSNSQINFSMWRNQTYIGSSVGGMVSDVSTLGVGSYSYLCNTSGNQNYTSQSTTNTLTINDKNTSFCSLSYSLSSPQVYGTPVNASCSCTNTEAAAQLYLNGANITSQNYQNLTLPAGVNQFICNVTETTNWKNATTNSSFTITQAAPTINLTASPGWSFVWGTAMNVSCYSPISQVTVNLYRNSTALGTATNGNRVSDTSSLATGSYNYTCTVNESQNYTAGSTENTLSITGQASTCNLTFTPSSPQSYGTNVNASCSCTNLEVSLGLYRNGINATTENNQNVLLSAGSHNYICNVSAGTNYSSATTNGTFVVNKAASSLNLTINGLNANYTQNVSFSVSQNCSLIAPPAGTLALYKNLTLINNGSSPLFNTTTFTIPGTYPFNCSFNGNENYTSGEQGYSVIAVDLIAPNVTLNYPASGYYNDSASPVMVDFNCSASDNYLLKNFTLQVTTSNGTHTTEYVVITDITGAESSAAWALNLSAANYSWNCLAYDYYGNSAWGTSRNFILNGTPAAPSEEVSLPSAGGGGGGGGGGGSLVYRNVTQKATCTPTNLTCGKWLPENCTIGKQSRTCKSISVNCTIYEKYESRTCACVPEWECTDWSECSEAGTQEKVCTDISECGHPENVSSQSCEYRAEAEAPEVLRFGLPTAWVGKAASLTYQMGRDLGYWWLVVLGVLLLCMGIVYVPRLKKCSYLLHALSLKIGKLRRKEKNKIIEIPAFGIQINTIVEANRVGKVHIKEKVINSYNEDKIIERKIG
ncbi:hypothetical protein HZC30_08055 [Candidatus Woesearchaeota archaeon]|nr:hypothetical protein [Candidatus Woesearchaeota archaeon]